MEIRIPFLERFRKPMLDGTKTWSSRNKRYGKAGDTFPAFSHAFDLLKVERRVLWEIAKNHWKEEGCNSSGDFMQVWAELHKRKGWTPDKRVYVHIFRRAS